MEANGLQQQLFNHLKEILPRHLSLADELSDLLNISADSAYRRIRGEKQLTISEMKLICGKYHISLDQFLHLDNDTVVFRAPDLYAHYEGFAGYLTAMLNNVKNFLQFKEKKMMYLCKDAPFWDFYLFPELGAFKTFFWIRSIKNDPAFLQKKFSLEEHLFDDCIAIGQEILNSFNEIPNEEIWNNESFNSTINQISYYRDAGLFCSDNDFLAVIDSLLRTINHLEQQATAGFKFTPGGSELTWRMPISFYVNDLIIGNNTIYGQWDGAKISWITYSVLNTLATKNIRFNEHLFAHFNTLKSRSTLISGTGEKERVRFFNSLRERVNTLKK
jgi:hypothetical protein